MVDYVMEEAEKKSCKYDEYDHLSICSSRVKLSVLNLHAMFSTVCVCVCVCVCVYVCLCLCGCVCCLLFVSCLWWWCPIDFLLSYALWKFDLF